MEQSDTTQSQAQSQLPLRMSPQQTSVHYANMCRGSMTPEEVMLDFGLNPNAHGRVSEEPVQITARVIMTPPSAKRLLHLLHMMLSRHEESFGPIPVDPAGAARQPAGTATSSETAG